MAKTKKPKIRRTRKTKPPRPAGSAPRGLAVRIIAAVLTVVLGLFLAGSLLSFDPADPPSEARYPANGDVHNWCGGVGAQVAHYLILSLGDAAYALILFVLASALLWLSHATGVNKLFRVVGAVLLLVTVAVVSAMIPVDARLPVGNGGVLGVAIWMFLEPRLGAFGTVLLVVPTTVVGLLLMTDTWFILLPVAIFKWLRNRARDPYRRLAAAVSTAGPASAVDTEDAEDAEDTEPAECVPARRARKTPKTRLGEAEGAKASARAEEEPADEAAPSDERPLPKNVVIRQSRSAKKKTQDPSFTFTPPPCTARNQDYQLPPVDLLKDSDDTGTTESEDVIREKAQVLGETLEEFGVSAEVVAIETGPVITQYEIALAPGVKVGKVIGLSDDIAIAMKAPNVRIVAPLPGKDTIGVEVPNTHRQVVRLKEIVLAAKSAADRLSLPLFLGKDSGGKPLVKDLGAMPHLLIGGTTGSGKSVCLNTIIISLLLTRTPDDLRMIMIDPKMVELSVYKKLPHLLCPVVNDMRKAEAILGWLVDKMEERYRLLSAAGVRNLAAYNRLGREKIIERFQPATPEDEARLTFHLPHVVVIVDELSDLMMVAAKEVEAHVTRLSQKSRAVGIHLVMATQRPSVDVLTGLIKSNLPVRVAFQVASRVDSRTILDSMGAEKLLGQGDLLFMTPGASKFSRAQGAFVSDHDIQAMLDHTTQVAEPEFQRELVQLKSSKDDDAGDVLLAVGADDGLYNKAIEVVLEEERGSVSLLQRRLGIGYGRAARLVDQMAKDGIVGGYKGSQARETLLTIEQWHALKAQQNAQEDPGASQLTDEEAAMET